MSAAPAGHGEARVPDEEVTDGRVSQYDCSCRTSGWMLAVVIDGEDHRQKAIAAINRRRRRFDWRTYRSTIQVEQIPRPGEEDDATREICTGIPTPIWYDSYQRTPRQSVPV